MEWRQLQLIEIDWNKLNMWWTAIDENLNIEMKYGNEQTTVMQ